MQIKILKRQGDPKNTKASAGQQLSCTPTSTELGSKKHKSLAEREADYASARARILGSDYKSDGGGGDVTVTSTVANSSGTFRGEETVKRQPKWVVCVCVCVCVWCVSLCMLLCALSVSCVFVCVMCHSVCCVLCQCGLCVCVCV